MSGAMTAHAAVISAQGAVSVCTGQTAALAVSPVRSSRIRFTEREQSPH